MPHKPKYLDFHLSLTAELDAIQDRLAQLVAHRLSSGEHRESALRMMLRRHLPPSLIVGRGFIVTREDASAQIDVLVVDGSRPCLYRDGDLMVVTPDLVRAIVEVKTSAALTGRDKRLPEIVSQSITLAQKGALCDRALRGSANYHNVWTGLFVYDSAKQPEVPVLQAIREARKRTGHAINCVALGRSHFFRYWGKDEIEMGALSVERRCPVWHAYRFCDDKGEIPIAPSYFLGNIIDAVSHVDRAESGFAWFPLVGGKEQYGTHVLFEGDLQIAEYYS